MARERRVEERTDGAATAQPQEEAPTWHALSPAETADRLGTGASGLTAEDAAVRLTRHGPNEVEPERPTPWPTLLLRQFRDPLIYILLIAAGVTIALRDYADAGVIAAVVLINAVIGFIQELKARDAIRGLARLSAPRAEVVRDGRAHIVESRVLVPGDVVLLAAGARVPADVRLVAAKDLEIDESLLTGESRPSRKQSAALAAENLVAGDQLNIAFSGTTVTRGRGRGVVIRTGGESEIGRIAASIRQLRPVATPLQQKIARFGRRVGVAILILSAVLLLIGLARGMAPADIFITAVALAVSAIPEGLPVVMTVTLAVGVGRMARRNAIVRSLPAVETLGSTTVIGSDKTGTLTLNAMTVRAVIAGDRIIQLDSDPCDAATDPVLESVLRAGVLANEADAAAAERNEMVGDPTDTALLVAAQRCGLGPSAVRLAHPESDIQPFDAELRLAATLNANSDGERFIYMKGAPETILQRCSEQLTDRGVEPLDMARARERVRELGARGMRVLAMARKATPLGELQFGALDGDFVYLGAQAMEDPVRPEAVAAVEAARTAGIRVLMLTGDHVETARVVGRQLGLAAEGALEGQALDQLEDAELERLLDEIDIYARVAPEHKLRLVERLKSRGHVVAVTGDGVNDAPALRAAHIGVAMGKGGTDVAREAADMVLADDNFATITAAVEEGRTVFSNVRKVSFFLLSTAVAEVITILVAVIAGWPLPFLAAQILWINLVTNGLQDVALAFEKGEPDQLLRPPRPLGEGIVTLRILERLGGVGAVLALGTLAMFWWTLEQSGDLSRARTVAMTQMVVFQFFHVFNSRSLDRSIFVTPLFSNRFLFVSIVAAAAAHAAVLHVGFLQNIFRTTPLSAEEWLLIIAVASTAVIGGELDKWRNRRKGRLLG
jgi:calcium-translocating P-type ATPase